MLATSAHDRHPAWRIDLNQASVLGSKACVVNFGNPEARAGMFKIVTDHMKSAGMQAYRQDFGTSDPCSHWDSLDAPDRQGIGEIRHISGLYEYWDGIAAEIPEVLLEGCAGGGRRIDLETISHMHTHQKTDYWFDHENDQTSIWGLSQYLPNNCFVAHLDRLDEYAFHSTLASSLCVGWRADDPKFDTKRATELVKRYKAVRHLLTAAWYPLVPYAHDKGHWLAMQYHRPDLGEGIVLVFRRPASIYAAVDLALRSLEPDAVYSLHSDRLGNLPSRTGKELMNGLPVDLKDRPDSDMIHYRRK